MLALVGGRNYGITQLNHAVAQRPTGSIFKPFVYAAAFNTASTARRSPARTSCSHRVTMLERRADHLHATATRSTRPRNFEGEYHGQVTARYALQHSLNIATIDSPRWSASTTWPRWRATPASKSARGTPSVAIGAYDATPLDMAGAYTVFANNGVHIDPWMLATVRNANGDIDRPTTRPTAKQVLDPRVAYLTTNLMENVMNHGTGEPRARTRLHRARRGQDRHQPRRLVRRATPPT